MIQRIENKEIKEALKEYGHQYVAGSLGRPQGLLHINSTIANVGIGYHHSFESEPAHYHTECTEFEYVIKGCAKLIDIDREEEFLLKKGDFFVIEVGTKYAVKAKKNCEIIFFKTPAVNDKKLIELDDDKKQLLEYWQSGWDCQWGTDKKKPKEPKVIHEKNHLVSEYKKDIGIPENTFRNDLDLKVLKEIIFDASKTVLNMTAAVLGFFACFTISGMFDLNFLGMIVLLILFLILVLVLINIRRYSRRIIRKKIKNLDYIILEDDFIANMIRLLSDKSSENSNLVFAMGMSETILQKPHLKDNTLKYTSICRDFDIFMSRYFGIDMTKEILEKYKPEELKVGTVIDMKFKLPKVKDNIMSELGGKEFTVLYYINSIFENDDNDKMKVEDARFTVCKLIDKASDYIYENYKHRGNVDITLMVPAIGTGKDGKGPYRQVLFEMINNFSLPNSAKPNRVYISLRDYELLGDSFAADRILHLAKKTMEF